MYQRFRWRTKPYGATVHDALTELYVSRGMSVIDVAAVLGCAENMVYKNLRAEGIPLRPRSHSSRPKLRDSYRDDAVHWYRDEGLTLQETADRLGVSINTVYLCLEEAGVPRRRGKWTDLPWWPETVEELAGSEEWLTWFLSHTQRIEGGCREWAGTQDGSGYGYVSIGQVRIKAHRLSVLLHDGCLPPDRLVCHRCDNPPCVHRPHLFLGSALDNASDAVRKGRVRTKLTVEEVKAIRRELSFGASQISQARTYGVDPKTIFKIAHRETWKHLK